METNVRFGPKADMTFIPERGSRFNSIKAASYVARILKGEKPNNLRVASARRLTCLFRLSWCFAVTSPEYDSGNR
jgi:hypothetical protein